MTLLNINVTQLLRGPVERLSSAKRYSAVPVIEQENVAEHSYYASLYSFIIAKAIENKFSNITIDWKCLLASAIVHDIDEAITGDIRRDIKYGISGLADNLRKLSYDKTKEIENSIGVEGIADIWMSAKDLNTIEGQILSVADILSVASYVTREYEFGNKRIAYIFKEVIENLTCLKFDLESGEFPYKGMFTYILDNSIELISKFQNHYSDNIICPIESIEIQKAD